MLFSHARARQNDELWIVEISVVVGIVRKLALMLTPHAVIIAFLHLQ